MMARERWGFLDGLRGFALLIMIIYHFCYDLFVVSGSNYLWDAAPAVRLWQQSGLCLFIAISGMSCVYMQPKKRWLRGLQLNLLGLAITGITYFFMPSELIVFGVLNFFGCALWATEFVRMLLEMAAVRFSVKKAYLGLAICLVGFTFLRKFDKIYPDWMAPLGLHSSGFYSTDYVPLLPYIFMFWLGCLLLPLLKIKMPNLFRLGTLEFLALPGRHSLVVYLVHQPVLLGLLTLAGVIK